MAAIKQHDAIEYILVNSGTSLDRRKKLCKDQTTIAYGAAMLMW